MVWNIAASLHDMSRFAARKSGRKSGGLEHIFHFSIQLEMKRSQTDEVIFFRVVGIPPTRLGFGNSWLNHRCPFPIGWLIIEGFETTPWTKGWFDDRSYTKPAQRHIFFTKRTWLVFQSLNWFLFYRSLYWYIYIYITWVYTYMNAHDVMISGPLQPSFCNQV